MSPIEQAARVPVAAVAEAFGLQVRGHAFGACPACNAERRGSHDRRLPCGFTDKGFRCFACQEKGTSVWLAALKLVGPGLSAGDPRWSQVLAWFRERGHITADGQLAPRAKVPTPSARERWAGLGPVHPGAPVSVSRTLDALPVPTLRGSDRKQSMHLPTVAQLDLARVDGIRVVVAAWRRDGTLADVLPLPAEGQSIRAGLILSTEPGVLWLRGGWYVDLPAPRAALVVGPDAWLGAALRIADAPNAGGWGRGGEVLVYAVSAAQALAGLALPDRVYAGPGAPADLAAVLGRPVTRLGVTDAR